ncbi:MAG: MATE family efflux transporter [Methanobrevibacter woesei]|uniref:MATE family efflux transporter n=1 Tax=Methanobrevibacter woesei TaxID=190976 RepID=UPI0023F26060|nr:MATE family efflux transporter [Methanobrevibacter woesei]MCI7292126.1 MATE family efflux transporter [Methanobrevibacter woesei]
MANKNIELMRGNPETAVRKLAIPVMISMLLTASYNIIDGIWITGLGEAAIAGIGFVTPIFMILNGVSVGLGSGATSSISRFVGAHDKNRASDSAAHSIIILFIASIILTLIFLVIQEPLLRIYGATGTALEEALSYSTPLFLGLIGIMFANGASGILRGEGDMKRAMYAVVVSVILNAILDPIFIYTFGLGAAGAAIATVLSSLISAVVILYWLLVKKDTYVDINLRKFKFNSKISKNILKVGIPASLDMFIMSIAVALYLIFITIISGDYGVAAYTSGQRIYLFAIMPLTAIGTAVVAVCGSAFGAENGDYLSRAHKYGAKFGILFGLAVTIIVVIFATPIASIFAYTPETSHLVSGIALFLQFAFLSIPFTGAGMASSFLYQGIGRGVTSLFFTIFREVICTVILTYLFGIVFGWGLIGIWIGLAVGRSIASIVNYIYGRHTIKQIRTKLGT